MKDILPDVPFVKWAGGKRWLAPLINHLLDSTSGRHIEPFVGSGACFFRSTTSKAILSDINYDLINAYQIVRNDPEKLIKRLSFLPINKKTFNYFRKENSQDSFERAVRFIYLNRTAFNGLYRVNKKGEFNVPYGCKPGTKLCDPILIKNCSERLKDVKLITSNFSSVLTLVENSDKVYLDPPYTVKHNNNAFRRYNEQIFSWNDQLILADIANSMASKGINVIISNALHDEVLKLYKVDYFVCFSIMRTTCMAASAQKRGTCQEALFLSRNIIKNKLNIDSILNTYLPNKTYRIIA